MMWIFKKIGLRHCTDDGQKEKMECCKEVNKRKLVNRQLFKSLNEMKCRVLLDLNHWINDVMSDELF